MLTDVRRLHADPSRSPIALVLLLVPIFLSCVAIPVFTAIESRSLSIVFAIFISSAVFLLAEAEVPLFVIISIVFQNIFVSLASPSFHDTSEFDFVRGLSFVSISTLFLFCVHRFFAVPANAALTASVKNWMLYALSVVIFYFIFGVALNHQLNGPATYLRNAVLPLFAFVIGFSTGSRSRAWTGNPITSIACICLGLGYWQLFFSDSFYRFFNGEAFLLRHAEKLLGNTSYLAKLSAESGGIASVFDLSRVPLFNLNFFADAGYFVTRIGGPNFHPISFGYTLSILSIICYANGRRTIFASALPLMLVVGSKGATVLAVVVISTIEISPRVSQQKLFGHLCRALLIYTIATVLYGIHTADFHALGFVAGVKAFISNPAGHGLGSGGNLGGDWSSIDWREAQASGETSVPVESALGVMLNQLGLATIVLIRFYYVIARQLWGIFMASNEPIYGAAAASLMVLLANGVMQEEAMFAPAALGCVMLLCGHLVRRKGFSLTHEMLLTPKSGNCLAR